MTEDMQVRNLALNTQMSYVQQVSQFAHYFNKSPELLGPEDIRAYQVHLIKEKKLAPGTVGPQGGWLFDGDVSGQPISTDAVELACRKARRFSGIGKPISPHSMRHAFAADLLESGTDVRTIQLLFGHRNLATTARYLRIATSKVCSTSSPLDLLPRPISAEPAPATPQYF
jgi:site-specific recombinase XerD